MKSAGLIMIFLVMCFVYAVNPQVAHADGSADPANQEARLRRDMSGEHGDLVLARLTPGVQEKKRVPKPEKEKRKKEDQDKDEDEDDDESVSESCMGSILEAFLLGMCESHDSSPAEPAPAHLTPEPYAEEPQGFEGFEGFKGVLDPLDPAAEDIALWMAPGGEAVGARVTSSFPRGTPVEVLESMPVGDTEWFKVMGVEPYPFSGWVMAQDVAEELAPTPSAAGVTEPAPAAPLEPMSPYGEIPTISASRPSWQILADISVADVAGTGLGDDYKQAAFRAGAMLRMCPAGSFQVALGVSYTHADGNPMYNYKVTYEDGDIDSSRDIPDDSDIKILEIDLHVGQYYPIGGGSAYFAWGAGPSVFRVNESAQIYTVEFRDHNVVRGYDRRAEINKWRIGGSARLEIAYLAAGTVPLGAHLGFSVIPWNAKNEKSLTLDFLDDNAFFLVCFGMTFGYSFF